jgi:hypothetical protein
MTVVYEHSFDANEWYVISNVVIFSVVIFYLPKIFSLLEGIAHLSYGVFFSMFYDHTLSVPPWDFYDVNDASKYQFMDFLSYIMFGTYSYVYIYIYKKLNIKGFMNIFYIAIGTCLALLLERLSLKIGLFHFDKGYSPYWSIPIYIIAQMVQIVFFHLGQKQRQEYSSKNNSQ